MSWVVDPDLVQSYLGLRWIPCSETTDIVSSPMDNVYYAIYKRTLDGDGVEEMTIMLSLLGNVEICTPTVVSEFARIYSLPTHKYENNVRQFRRSLHWLKHRNKLIKGFTKSDDKKYYMVADKCFYNCYYRYGFCSKCGILRCSPVWCICGHKEVFNGWTSDNKQLDEFIKKSQLQTNSANDAYLEWIPFDCISKRHKQTYIYRKYYTDLDALPTATDIYVKLIPLEITDETHDLYYAEVNHLLMRHVY